MADVTLVLGDCPGDGKAWGFGVPANAWMEEVVFWVEACEASRDREGRCGRV